MPDPLVIPLTKDVWTKVGTGITAGTIYITNTDPNVYLKTYRLTGNTAPTGLADAVKMKLPKDEILHSQAIDFYIMPLNVDGEIRIDA